MPTDSSIKSYKLKKIIGECDFLDEKSRNEWMQKADKLPEEALQFTYKKFKDAKTKVENIYMSVALQYDPTGGDLVRETLKTIQQTI
jgi:hypothetical protein